MRYSEVEIVRAVVLYWRLGSYARTISALGYPEVQALRRWVGQRTKAGKLRTDGRVMRLPDGSFRVNGKVPAVVGRRFSEEQKVFAVRTYWRFKSFKRTIDFLGYPTRHTLEFWVRDRTKSGQVRKSVLEAKAAREAMYSKPVYSPDFRVKVVESILVDGLSVSMAARKYQVANPTVIYPWLKRAKEGKGLDKIPRSTREDGASVPKRQVTQKAGKRVKGPTMRQFMAKLPDDPQELKEELARTKAELEALRASLGLGKKVPSVGLEGLSAKDKTQVVNAIRDRIPFDLCLKTMGLAPATYYYQNALPGPMARYEHLRPLIMEAVVKSHNTYGSLRIWHYLRQNGVRVSEKVIRKLIKHWDIAVHYGKKRNKKFSSYKGEISPAPPNLVKGNFRPLEPNLLMVTDISEFSTKEGKVYFSPLIDCYDGKVVSWRTSEHATQSFVNEMLDEALRKVPDPTRLTIHSDRGSHYRSNDWLLRAKTQHFIRSMSRKGNSGDNAACEGFFGRMKNEMYYPYTWETNQDLIDAITWYINFHNNNKIRAKTGKTIAQHRAELAT